MRLKTNNILAKNQAGFTLIELLIVITILGILMSIAVPALSGVKKKADLAVAKSDLHNIMHSLEIYYLDHGEYPGHSNEVKLNVLSDPSESSESNLENLSIKNEASDYNYKSDKADGAENYIISYQDSNEHYYISTEESSLAGPIGTLPDFE